MENTTKTQMLIMGAGMAGIAQAVYLIRMLEKQGISRQDIDRSHFIILERAKDVGGVWRDNIYPGAAADVRSFVYCFSFMPDFPWTCEFPGQAELLLYIKTIVQKYRLRDHIVFNADIVRADWQQRDLSWYIDTKEKGTFQAKMVPFQLCHLVTHFQMWRIVCERGRSNEYTKDTTTI